MKFAIVFLALIATCMAACRTRRVRDEFESFKRQYRKAYSSDEEEQMRCDIFAENMARIEGHNLRKSRDASITWSLTINKFADYSTEEFISMYGGLNTDVVLEEIQRNVKSVFVADPNYKASTSKDWSALKKVGAIKNQAKCGSCWAFAAVAAVESAHAIKNNELLDLSEQQVVECASGTKYNNFACNGGLPSRAYDWWKASGGVTLEANYPYISGTGSNGSACQNPTTGQKTVKITGYSSTAKTPEALIQAVDTIGPVTVAVRAGHDSWQFYDDGHLCDSSFNSLSHKVDHAVVLIGYTPEYYIIKNSWGEGWGKDGFVHLCRSIPNNSGITGNNGLIPSLTGIPGVYPIVA